MKASRVVILLLAFMFTGASEAETAVKKISLSQARALVMASLTPQQRRLPKLETDSDGTPNSSKFWFFTVVWEGAPKGSVVVGSYAVDPLTGDVFSSTPSCYEEDNKGLKILQVRIRRILRLSKSHYLRVKTNGPLCDR